MMQFDHIGLFVKSLKIGLHHLHELINVNRVSDVIEDPVLKVAIQFTYDSSGLCYELVAPFGKPNPVDSVLKANKNILNHVAYRTDEFDADVKQFRKKGCIHLGAPQSSKAFAGKRVIFFLTPLRMVIELIEA